MFTTVKDCMIIIIAGKLSVTLVRVRTPLDPCAMGKPARSMR